MNKHQGQIVEYIVRKNGYSLSDLAKELKVNRRSLYNWFNQAHLKPEMIYRIGCVIRHDFSKEFPELFTASEFDCIYAPKKMDHPFVNNEMENAEHGWKDKYLKLLELVNTELLKNANLVSVSG